MIRREILLLPKKVFKWLCDISEKKKKLIAFSLASIMQTAFLAGDNSELIMGYSLKSKKQRDIFISDVVTTLMNDMTPAS